RGDQLVNTDDLKRVLQSARTVNVTKDRELLHVIPRDYILDGHEGIKNPVGMHGFRLDADAHVVTAAGASVRNLVKCIRGAGVEVEDVVLEPLASGGAVLRPDERANGVVLIDIGGGTTDVAIFKEGNVWHTTVLPVGGYQITRDIAIGLGVPFEMAESLKLKYGRLYPATNGVAGSPEVPTRVENGHGIMIQDVNDIIRARAEEILRLTLVELPAVDILTVAPSGVVLTGGSAKLPGMDAMCSEASRAPCRIGVPHNIHGLTDLLYDPAYATSVGLLLRGSMAEESDSKNHRPSHLRRLFFRAKRSLSRK
ncbi:MAG: cell division protein FtsA, partial [Dehalococcoidia bacterium]|nr:cell division protein FtsA [Dehalococcoidia bacterium]